MEVMRVLSVCEWLTALNEQKVATISGGGAEVNEQLEAELNQHREAQPDAMWEHVVNLVTTFYVKHRATLLDARLFVEQPARTLAAALYRRPRRRWPDCL